MQVCTPLQTDNHASTSPLSFTGRMPFLLPNQQRQSTEGNLVLKQLNQIQLNQTSKTKVMIKANTFPGKYT